MTNHFGADIVNVSVIHCYTIMPAWLASGVIKIKLQKPGNSSFHPAFENNFREHEKEFCMYLNPNGLAL